MRSIPQMPDRKVAGIYAIVHKSTSRVYVGSAVSIAKRWYGHTHKLKTSIHENVYLQNAWDKYGPDAFEWVILEEIFDHAQLIAAEQKWMDHYQVCNPNKGFNISPTAGSPLGRKHSEEAKEKVGRASRKRIHYRGILNEQDVRQILARCANGEYYDDIAKDFHVTYNMIGKIARRESYAKLEVSPEIEQGLLENRSHKRPRTPALGNKKLTEKEVRLIRQWIAEGFSFSIIAEYYGVSAATIYSIKHGKSWSHIL